VQREEWKKGEGTKKREFLNLEKTEEGKKKETKVEQRKKENSSS